VQSFGGLRRRKPDTINADLCGYFEAILLSYLCTAYDAGRSSVASTLTDYEKWLPQRQNFTTTAVPAPAEISAEIPDSARFRVDEVFQHTVLSFVMIYCHILLATFCNSMPSPVARLYV